MDYCDMPKKILFRNDSSVFAGKNFFINNEQFLESKQESFDISMLRYNTYACVINSNNASCKTPA
jgi:hypothetical protein